MPNSPETLALADSLRAPLLRAARRLRQEAQRAGSSALDALILGYIRRRPGVGVSELAQAEQVSRPSMSGHVKRLEAAGWIQRFDDQEDGRRSGLQITPAGEAQLDAVRQRRNDWLADRLARLTPEARAALAAAGPPLLQLLEQDQ
ncbi:MarR family winged helix-turn-helix transcriptional regulator [Phenylobacterium sp. 58.2.17]|uniref:MarR family winged helix-turn-helix transcriptional regulator n=1 Tax=Phenylobacterium sp. 58.2.17 TaxID=2969306 RepID=UPI0022648C94|nr:MarR family transcriptional regulator [Phenylobacterium sp. 58.2.17]MCX7588069.1 MarR family transcriptional regulator [Phenylobacterium sp. 58.2.17]